VAEKLFLEELSVAKIQGQTKTGMLQQARRPTTIASCASLRPEMHLSPTFECPPGCPQGASAEIALLDRSVSQEQRNVGVAIETRLGHSVSEAQSVTSPSHLGLLPAVHDLGPRQRMALRTRLRILVEVQASKTELARLTDLVLMPEESNRDWKESILIQVEG